MAKLTREDILKQNEKLAQRTSEEIQAENDAVDEMIAKHEIEEAEENIYNDLMEETRPANMLFGINFYLEFDRLRYLPGNINLPETKKLQKWFDEHAPENIEEYKPTNDEDHTDIEPLLDILIQNEMKIKAKEIVAATQRENFEFLEKAKIKRLSQVIITKEEKAQLKETAQEAEKNSFIDKYMKQAQKITFYNEIPCKLSAHWILSPILRNVKLMKADGFSYIDARVHILHWQDSQTGKNMLSRWGARILGAVMKDEPGNPGELADPDYYKIDKISQTTDASLLNRKILNPESKKREFIEKKGIIETADLLYMEEASVLFTSRGAEYTKNMPEIMITVMEPFGSTSNFWTKKLKETDMETQGRASLYFSTRPIDIKFYESITGLIQRMLFYPREITDALHQDMTNSTLAHMFGKAKDAQIGFTPEEMELINELTKIQNFLKSVNYKIEARNEEELSAYLMGRYNEINNIIDSEIINEKKKTILQTMIRGSLNQAYKLACHSAVMRYSKYIEKQDAEYAMSLLSALFDAWLLFIDKNISDPLPDKIEKKDITKTLKTLLSLPAAKLRGVSRIYLRKILENDFEYSKRRANLYLTRSCEKGIYRKEDREGTEYLFLNE
jgi:hypothetical protein